MTKPFGKLYRDLWSDGDFLDLTLEAQHLYMAFVSNPQINFAGVLPFAPGRYVALSRTMTARKFTAAVNELRSSAHIIAEKHSGEILVRTYIRHDGSLRNRNLAAATVKAIGRTYSDTIRDTIVDELARHCREEPDLPGWEVIARDAPDLMESISDSLLGYGAPEEDPKLPTRREGPYPTGYPDVVPLRASQAPY